MLAIGCMNADQAVGAIDWTVYITIAFAFGVSAGVCVGCNTFLLLSVNRACSQHCSTAVCSVPSTLVCSSDVPQTHCTAMEKSKVAAAIASIFVTISECSQNAATKYLSLPSKHLNVP